MTQTEEILSRVKESTTVLTNFRIETAERLGRIEATCELNGHALNSLEDRVTEVEVDTKVAAKVGGRRGGAFGAALGVVVVTISETLRTWFA